jgi:hypothetical protein
MKRAAICLSIILLSFNLGTAHATLVGYWTFDEGTGAIAYDSSGYGNTGTITGATWVQGKFGGALSFEGDGSYVNVANSTSINLSTWTVSFWASLYDVTRTQVLLDKRNGQWDRNYEFVFYYNEPPSPDETGDYLSANIGDGSFLPSNYANAAYGPVTLTANQFYYFAATYDQAFLKLYLDGTLIGSKQISMQNITGDGDLHIGAHGYTSMSPTYGIIDEVRIYDFALSQSEIVRDMGAPVPAPATMLLLGSGLVGLAWLRRKFKNR